MSEKHFKEDHIKAFMVAGKKANPKNVVSESSIADSYLEITRQLVYPTKPPHVVLAALNNWGVDDDGDGGLSCTVTDNGGGSKIYLSWRMYFGIEVRDNSISDFESWAKHKSQLFDEAQDAIKGLKFKDKITGKVRIRFFGCREPNVEKLLATTKKIVGRHNLMMGKSTYYKNTLDLEISDFTTHDQQIEILKDIESYLLRQTAAGYSTITPSIEIG